MRIYDSGQAKQQNLIPPSAVEQEGTTLTPEQRVIESIKYVYDPEIPVNVYDLGLIYQVRVNPNTQNAVVRMTLTSPACPEAQTLPEQVKDAAAEAEGIHEASVNLVWEPRWSKEMMAEEAKLHLGFI